MARTRLPQRRKGAVFDSSLAIINIVLLLIFFFITTGSLMSSRTVEVALPETTRLPLDLLPDPLLIVTGDMAMLLNGEPIEKGALSDALIDSPTVYVLADRDLGASALLGLLDAEELIAVEVQLVTLHLNTEDAPE
ncbi:biopolymer transporter ExbD [uncultured Tateyamaria sp.]|uniref:ExbD/TolR family protein n=1 Tax=uncultured Tateyamaria sp. TaxID=455651 RepID=UPI002635E2EE|nr:biopolymer transporter ExbD [uncultured Tateyamaria sp.]